MSSFTPKSKIDDLLLKINKKPQSTMSKAEVFSFLDQNNGSEKFDREIAEQLFERMDHNGTGHVRAGEISNTLTEATSILSKKVESTREYITQLKLDKQKILNDLKEVHKADNEGNLENGGPSLYLYVREGVNMQALGAAKDLALSCYIIYGDNRANTKFTPISEPYWDENVILYFSPFSYFSDLDQSISTIEILLMTYEQELSQDGNVGSCHVNIKDITNGSIINIPISDFSNNVTSAKLAVEICIYMNKVFRKFRYFS